MRKRRKMKKIITISLFVSLMIIAVGYASFNTNVSLSAKGNVYNKGDLCYETSDNKDGTVTITDYDVSCGTEVTIPSTIKGKVVTKIDSAPYDSDKVFNNKGLTKVIIPDSVTYIGEFAFYRNKIKEVDLGSGVEEIDNEAFHSNEISDIQFPSSLKYIGYGAFMNNYLTSLSLPNDTMYMAGAFTYNNFKPEEAFIYSRNDDGSLNYSVLNSYASRTFVSNIIIPSTVKTIEYYSLRFARASEVTFPDGFEKIFGYATMQSSIKVINLPSSVSVISVAAFDQSPNLEVINIDKFEGSISGSPWGASNAVVNFRKS